MPVLDAPLSELLRSVGYAVASHVMARASLSRGTGRYEEPLTADVADLVALFDPYAEFLRVRGSRSRLGLYVVDFNKQLESNTGADFVIVVRGSAGRPRQAIRKLVLVQAKRENWGRGGYAASTNHVAKAQTMATLCGLTNAFFAYYHSNAVISAIAAPWATVPNFLYSSPIRGNQHFFSAGSLHPSIPEGFLEQSAYRRHLLGNAGAWQLPPGYEWGIGFLGADHFVDATNQVINQTLPTMAHVLSTGRSFGDFLVDLAECRAGEMLTEGKLRQILMQLRQGPAGEGEGAFDPMFAIAIEYASGGPDDDENAPDLDEAFWAELGGFRVESEQARSG